MFQQQQHQQQHDRTVIPEEKQKREYKQSDDDAQDGHLKVSHKLAASPLAEMNAITIKQLCKSKGLYMTPELNDTLYLNFQGFRKVQNLEDYSNVQTLFLDTNELSVIENLHTLNKLRNLYFQCNCISHIQNLDCLPALAVLNISNNCLTSLDGIQGLSSLTTLMAAGNQITSVDGIQHCTNLQILDLSKNNISDTTVVNTLSLIPHLKCLYLKENPVVSRIANYRKHIICHLISLTFLDDRPVTVEERQCATAWFCGGRKGEEVERKRIWEEKISKQERNMEAWKQLKQNSALIKVMRAPSEKSDSFPSVTYQSFPDAQGGNHIDEPAAKNFSDIDFIDQEKKRVNHEHRISSSSSTSSLSGMSTLEAKAADAVQLQQSIPRASVATCNCEECLAEEQEKSALRQKTKPSFEHLVSNAVKNVIIPSLPAASSTLSSSSPMSDGFSSDASSLVPSAPCTSSTSVSEIIPAATQPFPVSVNSVFLSPLAVADDNEADREQEEDTVYSFSSLSLQPSIIPPSCQLNTPTPSSTSASSFVFSQQVDASLLSSHSTSNSINNSAVMESHKYGIEIDPCAVLRKIGAGGFSYAGLGEDIVEQDDASPKRSEEHESPDQGSDDDDDD